MTHAPAPKKASPGDWHPADIVAALRKADWTLRRLSAHHGYNSKTLRHALAKPYPRAERLIAEALGLEHPSAIWPSRYDANGQPYHGRGRASAAAKGTAEGNQ